MRAEKDPLYVIVHENCVPSEASDIKEELERIKREEDYLIVEGSIKERLRIPEERPIKVCGGYDPLCVPAKRDILIERGYDAEVHKIGSYSPLDEEVLEDKKN